ncbi:hybrid sensor histidine kinase/response regulator [Leptothoe kymatousa]|uniref:histidine kinase n=1 Tax=Leptothoe kymatousa TAU-MAC 1615 TaxID=2364775 RepID=A0ABS5XZE8_9CYAN|nr:response regulator [Leptothoe kymatousa]MBT9310950.1 response regulator [Leptothoe kymatousa TAU-MAC 1615]
MVSDFRPEESYQFFLQEVPELLQALESGFLNLHQSTEIDHIWNLMCTTHSIKGGAACASMDAIQDYAHHLESCLKVLAEQPLPIALATEELLLQALDYLKAAVVEEVKGGSSHSVLLQGQPVLDALNQQIPTPETDDAPEMDVVHVLFKEDVTKGLQRLKQLLTDQTIPARLETFKIQVEILQGIGEIANLPGFIAIATTTLTALEQEPQQFDTIGTVALNDFTAAKSLVIEGDRNEGGTPSQALASLANVVAPPDTEPTPESFAAEETLETQISSEARLPSPPISPTGPILLSSQNDEQQWTSINDLVGEMVTLDSRLMAHQTQSKETLVVGERSLFRLKQLLINLQHRYISAQNTLSEEDTESSLRYRIQQQKYKRLQADLQDMSAEMSQLGEFFKDFNLVYQQHQHLLKQHHKQLKQAQNQLLQAQMVPISVVLNQFPRIVRQLSQQQNKSIRLLITGDTTLVNKTILEKLYEPLLHLIRNAIDHGIEPNEIRQAAQKSLPATIAIRVKRQGYTIYIEVEDDGRGIDVETIRSKIVAKGWLAPEEADSVPNQHLHDYLFQPNFSTAATVSQISGRGVGLYAVRSQINDCQGSVRVSSKTGSSTRFTLRLPANTSVTKLLLFRSQQQLYALAVDTIVALTYATPKRLKSEKNQIYYLWKQQKVPLYTLFHLLTYRYPLPSVSREALGWLGPSAVEQVAIDNTASSFHILIIGDGEAYVALRVDEILSQQELVTKALDDSFITPPDYLQGAVILGDGQLLPVLNGNVLVERCLQLRYPQIPKLSITQPSIENTFIPTIMIVDDSLTIRSVLALTLHKNGYRVIQAKDGQEALPLLEQNSDTSAIICDIEMPHMSGIELLSRCRRSGLTIPIIMLTYRNSDQYRLLAKQLGASAYMTKPYLDKELLQVLQNCLNEHQQSPAV